MSSLHCRARCLSANAFNPHKALSDVFEHAFAGGTLRHVRTFHRTPSRKASHRNAALSKKKAEPIADKAKSAVNPSNANRLLETLRAIRQRNRDKLIRRVREYEREEATASIVDSDVNIDSAQDNANGHLKIHYMTELHPTLAIRPTHRSSRPPVIESPAQRFQQGEAVFTQLNFGRDVDAQTVVATNVSPNEGETILDYQGYACEAAVTVSKALDQNGQPWLSRAETLTGVPALGQEMQDFYNYVRLSDNENKARTHVVEEVRKAVQRYTVKKHKDEFYTQVFGSFASGFSLATSDIDIRLTDSRLVNKRWAPSGSFRNKIQPVLTSLAQYFRAKGFEDVRVVHARYPLVSMTHKSSGIPVQVVASNSDNVQTQLLQSWRKRYPEILPLFATIKSCLQLRGLMDVFHGGLGSYPLLIMIRASLDLAPGTTLGEQLINFLSFFGRLDTKLQGIGPDPFPRLWNKILDPNDIPAIRYPNGNAERYVHAFLELSAANANMPFLPCIQDPTDKHNDVGRRTFAWKHIAATFKHLHDDLKTRIAASEAGASPQPLLQCMIGPFHEKYAHDRNVTEGFGASLADNPFKNSKALPTPVSRPAKSEFTENHKEDPAQASATPMNNANEEANATKGTLGSAGLLVDQKSSNFAHMSLKTSELSNITDQARQYSSSAVDPLFNQRRSFNTSARQDAARSRIMPLAPVMRSVRQASPVFHQWSVRRQNSTKDDFELPEIPDTRKDQGKYSSVWRLPSDPLELTGKQEHFSSEFEHADASAKADEWYNRKPVDPQQQAALLELQERFLKYDDMDDKSRSEQDYADLFEDLFDTPESEEAAQWPVTKDIAARPSLPEIKLLRDDVVMPTDEPLEDDPEPPDTETAPLALQIVRTIQPADHDAHVQSRQVDDEVKSLDKDGLVCKEEPVKANSETADEQTISPTSVRIRRTKFFKIKKTWPESSLRLRHVGTD